MYHLRMKGNHYDMGRKMGNIFIRTNAKFNIHLDSFQTKFGIESGLLLKKFFPEAYNEVKGITDTIDYPQDEFLAWLMCMGCCLDIDEENCTEVRGCTAFAFSVDNQIYYGRNNDLPPFLKKLSKSILYCPEHGNKFILNTSSFINGEEGINEFGLVAAMTFVIPKIDEITAGINSVFLVRYILEKCKTVKEGLNALKNLPIASNCNILLADLNGDMLVAECNPKKIIVRQPHKNRNGNDFIVSVNHFSSTEMLEHEAKFKNTFDSKLRYETAYNALNSFTTNPIDYSKELLSGKFGFMCQYEKKLNFDTIWATVFDLGNRIIYRAEGNPKKTKFILDARLEIK